MELVLQADRKVTKKVSDTFNLFVKCSKHFRFCGSDYTQKTEHHISGVDAVKAFNAIDSLGINPPCCEPDLLADAWNGKAALNLQIKMWAQGINDGVTALWELQEEYDWLPEWVWEAVVGQAGRKCRFDWYYKK